MIREVFRAIRQLLRIVRWARSPSVERDPVGPSLTDTDRRTVLKLLAAIPVVALLPGETSDLADLTDHVPHFFGFPRGATGPRLYSGLSDPRGQIFAPLGSLWMNAAEGTLWVNVNGKDEWVQK